MRTPLVAGNWKMFKTVHEAVAFAKELKSLVRDATGLDIVVAPPFTALHPVADALRSTNVAVAAQDLYWEKEGAFTGEVSAGMVREAGGEYAIIGHSERRRLFGETDVSVNRKIQAAFGSGLTPIVCVGETLDERESGTTDEKCCGQIEVAFAGLSSANAERCVVAYEPIWAIGTGRNATADDADATIGVIRARLREQIGDTADQMRILYGGSVKPGNIAELMAMPEIDGALVGGASLDPDEFARVIRYGVS